MLDINERFPRLLRLPDVCRITGLRRSRIYELEKAGLFPKRRKLVLGGRAVAWLESEILSWVESRPLADIEDE